MNCLQTKVRIHLLIWSGDWGLPTSRIRRHTNTFDICLQVKSIPRQRKYSFLCFSNATLLLKINFSMLDWSKYIDNNSKIFCYIFSFWQFSSSSSCCSSRSISYPNICWPASGEIWISFSHHNNCSSCDAIRSLTIPITGLGTQPFWWFWGRRC